MEPVFGEYQHHLQHVSSTDYGRGMLHRRTDRQTDRNTRHSDRYDQKNDYCDALTALTVSASETSRSSKIQTQTTATVVVLT
jgi:hypothetical protein